MKERAFSVYELECAVAIARNPVTLPLTDYERELLARVIEAYPVGHNFQLADWLQEQIEIKLKRKKKEDEE